MTASYNPTNLQVNISSLYGQLSLSRTESALNQSIRNLSSGVRIHSGRDDPVGFVASSSMQTDIVSMSQAVTNCQRINAVLSTTDGVLAHMGNLLNDLRGLVTQAANTGAESADTLAMLQLEADAILSSIDYLSSSTSLLDKNLIDGSLDFTTYGVDASKISNLRINQASFKGRTELDISVQVLETPRQAELYYSYGALKESVVLNLGGSGGYQTFSFDKSATVEDIASTVNRFSDATGVAAKIYLTSTPGTLALTSYGKDNDIILTASETGAAAGNFVVKYTAAPEGNANLSLRVNEGSGNEPTEIEVLLETELWQNAEYHYNGANDGVSNNEFTITSRLAGAEFNDIQFVIENVFGTATPTGINVDLTSEQKQFRINVSYDPNDPTSPANTTVADLETWIKESSLANTYFALNHVSPSDGSGPLLPSSSIEQTQKGVDGGAVLSTAEQVATLINNSPLLKNLDGSGRVTASLPTGSLGTGIVTPFSDVAYYGDPLENNYLQFLAPKGSPEIKFVSTPGTPLSIDDTTDPPVYAKASTLIQGLDAGTSFTVRSLATGPDGDGVGVILRDTSEESVVFDAQLNAVVMSIDFTGRATDPNRDALSMNDLRQMFDSDPTVSSRFVIDPVTSYDPLNPPTFSSSNYLGINAKIGETAGGVLYQGSIVVHLETDVNGLIKTTANDLVKFFNDPSTTESQAILDRLGISVSNIDPDNPDTSICIQGLSTNGTGLLTPTYDLNACIDTEGLYPNIVFSSYGSDKESGYPTATIASQNGLDARFTITALQSGATMNNTRVRIVSDVNGPVAGYNSVTKTLTIGIKSPSTNTANDIINLINTTPDLNSIFHASKAPFSTGGGVVAVGDTATLTGGIKTLDGLAQGMVVAANGANAMFEVSAKKTDAIYNDTEIMIVADTNGPTVSYDTQSKQLTIGVNPLYPLTAKEVVHLINSTPATSSLFEASIPETVSGTNVFPTGEGLVKIGDRGTLRVDSKGMSLGAAMLGADDDVGLGITFHSVEYGRDEFVSVQAMVNTEFPLTDRFGNVVEKTYGTDVVAKINGQLATGKGCIASLANTELDLSIWLDPSVKRGEVFGFRVDGGGALVQLGPNIAYTQQSRIGIQNTNTAYLGGVNGYLSQIRSGESYDLLTDTKQAFKIIEDVTNQLSSMRGRLGAFQKYQVEANMENLLDTIEIESSALSVIKDADFAAESSAMLRQQLLMQSNISVLQSSNQSMQLLLGLLQG